MKDCHAGFAVALSLSLAIVSGPTVPSAEAAEGEVAFSMTPSADLSGTVGQVLGKDAVPANKANWPATYTFRNAQGGGCTATAIGPRAVLTAAHCVPDGGSGRVLTGSGRVDIVCTHHPDYSWDRERDFALCAPGNALSMPDDGFEKINTDESLLQKGSQVVLLGYGCLTQGGEDHNYGTLYRGKAPVVRLPGSRKESVVTKGGAAVCFGDSGGGAYFYTSNKSRTLIGVNSQGDIWRTSWIAPTATSSFQEWARTWAQNEGAGLCGLTDSVSGCRQ